MKWFKEFCTGTQSQCCLVMISTVFGASFTVPHFTPHKSNIFKSFLYSGHSGVNVSWKKINKVAIPICRWKKVFWKLFYERFYFYGGEKYCREKCRTCIPCAYKNDTIWAAQITPLRPIPVVPKLFFRINADVMGPFLKSNNGNKYVAIAVDAFSKYVEFAGDNLISNKIGFVAL